MKQPIRAFSIGLFTSGIILLIIFIFFDGGNNKQTEPSADDMIVSLEVKGYHVLTDSDYIALSVKNDQDQDKNTEKDNKDNQENDESEEAKDNEEEDKEKAEDQAKNDDDNTTNNEESDEPEEETTTYKLTIEEGMASSDISKKLANNDIIKDAEKFNKFLQDEGYDQKVQIGDLNVSDDMNFQEIANTITK